MAGAFDPGVWSAAVAALFRERSAIVRAGATVHLSAGGVRVPYVAEDDIGRAAQLFPASGDADPPDTPVTQSRLLHPAANRIVAELVLTDGLVAAIGDDSRLIAPLQDDLARSLAHRADRVCLLGGGTSGPEGIDAVAVHTGSSGSSLWRHRGLVYDARHYRPLGRAGWILSPHMLALLIEDATGESFIEDPGSPFPGAVVPDGRDGGMLLGLPYVVAGVDVLALSHSFLAVDWSEAWLVAEEGLVSVEITAGAGTTVIRATIHFDFGVRRREGFLITLRS